MLESLKVTTDVLQVVYGADGSLSSAAGAPPRSMLDAASSDLHVRCARIAAHLDTHEFAGMRSGMLLESNDWQTWASPGWCTGASSLIVTLDIEDAARDAPLLLASGFKVSSREPGMLVHLTSASVAANGSQSLALAFWAGRMASVPLLPAFLEYPPSPSTPPLDSPGSLSAALDMLSFTLFPPQSAELDLPSVGLAGSFSGVQMAPSTKGRCVSLAAMQLDACRREGEQVVFTASPTLRCAPGLKTESLSPALGIDEVVSLESEFRRFDVWVAPLAVMLSPDFARFCTEFGSAAGRYTAPSAPAVAPAATVELKHAKFVIASVSIEVASATCWDATALGVAGGPRVVISLDESIVMLHQERAETKRPWLLGDGALVANVEVSLLGASIVAHHIGPAGATVTPLLRPTDCSVSARSMQPAGTFAIALRAAWLPLQVSMFAIDALGNLASSFINEQSAPSLKGRPCAPIAGVVLLDDLRGGMFSLAPGAVLAPLQLAVGDQCVRWLYPSPRRVASLRAALGHELCLARYDAGADDFVDVTLRPSHHGCVVEEAVEASEWRLSWSAKGSSDEFLRSLYINALGDDATLPGIAAPLTVVLAADRGVLTLAGPVPLERAGPKLVVMDSLFELTFSDMTIAVQPLGDGMVVRANAIASLEYNANSQRLTVVEPVSLRVLYSELSTGGHVSAEATDLLAAENTSDLVLATAAPAARRSGQSVVLELERIRVNVSSATFVDLPRLLAAFSATSPDTAAPAAVADVVPTSPTVLPDDAHAYVSNMTQLELTIGLEGATSSVAAHGETLAVPTPAAQLKLVLTDGAVATVQLPDPANDVDAPAPASGDSLAEELSSLADEVCREAFSPPGHVAIVRRRRGGAAHVVVCAADVAEPRPLAPAAGPPFEVVVRAAELQVCHWDAAPDADDEEVACLTVDALTLGYSATALADGVLTRAGHLSAAALQLDAFADEGVTVLATSPDPGPRLEGRLRLAFDAERATRVEAALVLPHLVLFVDDALVELSLRVAEGAAPAAAGPPPAPPSLREELAVDARIAAMPRVHLAEASLSEVRVCATVNLTAATPGVPLAVDLAAAPLKLSPIWLSDVLTTPEALARGLAAHAMAEGLLNAPRLVGSLALLFSPASLLHSLRRGVADLVELPLAAGSASLLRRVSGWTVNAAAGFSYAASRAIDRTSVVNVLGAPVSGALGLVGDLASALSSAIGADELAPRRAGRVAPRAAAPRATAARLLAHEGLVLAPGLACGAYEGHWEAEEAEVVQRAAEEVASFRMTARPLVLILSTAVVVYGAGATPALVLARAGLAASAPEPCVLVLAATAAAPANNPLHTSACTVTLRFSREAWEELLPTARAL
jgi:hypothetical protein